MLWATVSDTSTLTLSLARLPAQRDLSRLPLPFVDKNVKEAVVLPFVLPADPSNETLQGAAIVASWFGQVADFRGTTFPVANDLFAEGNMAVVGVARQLPPALQLPQVSGPTVAVVANPSDPYGSILVVTGRTGAEVVAAATTLSIGARTLSGERAVVSAPNVPPRRPYDAPAWIPTDRPVKLGELVEASDLQGSGYVPGTFHVPFRTAPDLYTWRRRAFEANIHFRAPPGPIIDVASSRLDVGINGMFLRSYPLASNDEALDWVKRIFGTPVGASARSTAVPPWMVFGQNDLQFYFDARPLHRGDCVAIPEDLRMSVDPDSTIDLSRAHRFTTLPNLAFFAGSGFPFTRLADLSETAAVLPEHPSTVELSAFLGLMGRFGAMTFYPVLHLAVVRPGEVETVVDRDLLVLGTLQHMAAASAVLDQSPYRIDGARISVALPDPLSNIWRIFGDRTGEDRRRAVAALASPLSESASAIIGARSPWRRDRSVVVLLAGAPQGVEQMVQALGDKKLMPSIQGDLALLDGATMTSYRAEGVYTVGHLPIWLWPDWLLRDQPVEIIVLMLVACALGGIALNWALRRRATGRLADRTRLG